MYYKARQGNSTRRGSGALTPEEIQRAERAFMAVLWRRIGNPEFIAAHAEDIFALAQTEYARALPKGEPIRDSVAWLVNAAWRRTQNLLPAWDRARDALGEEALERAVERAAPSAEQLALEEGRAQKVRAAVDELTEDQRRVIALLYFSDNSMRGVGRLLGWEETRVRRCHKSALRKMYEVLGVETSDEIEFDVALAALLALTGGGSGLHLPAGVEAVIERAGHGAGGAVSRIQDLARRIQLGGGGDAAGVLAGSGVGRGLGACATVLAAACIAGAGVAVVPGTGLLGHDGSDARAPASQQVQHSTGSEAAAEEAPGSETAAPEPSSPVAEAGGDKAASESATPKPGNEAEQVRAQTDAFARAASEAGTSGSSGEAPAQPNSGAGASAADPGAEAQARQQFGGFR